MLPTIISAGPDGALLPHTLLCRRLMMRSSSSGRGSAHVRCKLVGRPVALRCAGYGSIRFRYRFRTESGGPPVLVMQATIRPVHSTTTVPLMSENMLVLELLQPAPRLRYNVPMSPISPPPGSRNAASPRMTFTNPIVTSCDAGDPWMIYHDGFYLDNVTLASCSTNAALCHPILTVYSTDELSRQRSSRPVTSLEYRAATRRRAWSAAIIRTDV